MSSEQTTNSSINANNVETSTLDPQMLKHIEKIMGTETTLLLIEQFLAYAPQQLTALQQSVVAGDSETLRQQAHQFKGESLQIGANLLSALCKEIEILAQEGQVETAFASLTKLETELERVKAALSQVGNYD